MITECEKKIRAAKTIEEMLRALEEYYDLSKPINPLMLGIARNKICSNLDAIVNALNIPPKQKNGRRSIL